MAEIKKEKLAEVIDACIDASANLHSIEIQIKGLRNEIDEISTRLFFHFKTDEEMTN